MRFGSLILASVFAYVCVSHQANAELITMDLSQIINSTGGTPGGAPPWLQADFDDHGGTGSVTLTIRATDLSIGEFMSEAFFNLDPAFNPANLQFGTPVIGGSFTAPTRQVGTNSQKADGDGYYDIEFDFGTTGGTRFLANNTYQVTMTSTDPITAGSFNVPASIDKNGTGNSAYYSAAHIQGLAVGTSTWVGSHQGSPVPEPSTFALALAGLAGVGLLYRRRAK